MSSGTSYDWAYERERELQRQAELRAELERLRARSRSLSRLHAALASQGIRAELPRIADVPQDATSAQLSIVVTEARSGLDALQERLDNATSRRAQERAARWAALPAAVTELPQEPSLSAALAEARAKEQAAMVTRLAGAAVELVETEAPRCAEDDLSTLTDLAGRVAGMDVAHARRALTDLESRVTTSIRGRRDREAAEQLRAELLCLTGELGQQERTELRERLAATDDRDLAGLRPVIEQAAAGERRRRSRTEVAEQVLSALRAQGYEVGESFEDMLADGRDVRLLTSTNAPGYGVRVTVDEHRDQILTTIVRRDDVDDGGDQRAQQLVCADLARVEEVVATGGVQLRAVLRRPPRAQVPTMPARHWPAQQTQAQIDAQQQAQEQEQRRRAAEHERQRQAGQRTSGRSA
ncbi:hypothetical protein [Dactylosporangium sp. NPDC000521]|uniref:hypothetical protein n=1 Tax=Dactylosporangium sp. NPDC000521 TaxID=3363975 RepID=UPI0036ABD835